MSDVLADSKTATNDSAWRIGLWLVSGVLLVLLTLPFLQQGWAIQGVGVIAGVVYLASLAFGPRGKATAWQVAIVLIVAIAMRLLMWSMPAVSGWDYWRYLWDGALTANRVSPYRYSPEMIAKAEVTDERIEQLRQEGALVLGQINHPHLRTIYPPVAQGLFAGAYWLKPFSLTSWRMVLLGFDILAALVVLALLRASGQRWSLWTVYLWNPLLIAEAYYGGHLDLVVGSLLILFAWALIKKRAILAAVVLALAVGVKIWPAVLVFFLWRSAGYNRRKLLLSLCVFVGLVGIIMAPYLLAFGDESSSGLVSYAKNWQWRSGVYRIFADFGRWLQWNLSLKLDGQVTGRGLSMLLLLVVACWQGLKRTENIARLCGAMAIVGLVMLLLGPVCRPWYYIALIPLAAVAGGPMVLLAWTVLLPLSYLPQNVLPDWAFILIGHVPIWVLLAITWRREARHV